MICDSLCYAQRTDLVKTIALLLVLLCFLYKDYYSQFRRILQALFLFCFKFGPGLGTALDLYRVGACEALSRAAILRVSRRQHRHSTREEGGYAL